MTWVSHKALTFATILVITGRVFTALIASFGSYLPDLLEGTGFMSPAGSPTRERWKRRHRTITHWWVPYAAGFILFGLLPIDILPDFSLFQLKIHTEKLLSLIMLGALFHILEDAVSGKVPFLNPYRKDFGIRLIKTGSVIEALFTILTGAIMILWAFKLGVTFNLF